MKNENYIMLRFKKNSLNDGQFLLKNFGNIIFVYILVIFVNSFWNETRFFLFIELND